MANSLEHLYTDDSCLPESKIYLLGVSATAHEYQTNDLITGTQIKKDSKPKSVHHLRTIGDH
jgi:hypothetical protein